MLLSALYHSKKVLHSLQKLVDPLMIILAKRNMHLKLQFGVQWRKDCLRNIRRSALSNKTFEQNIEDYLKRHTLAEEEERLTAGPEAFGRVGLSIYSNSRNQMMPRSRQGRRDFDADRVFAGSSSVHNQATSSDNGGYSRAFNGGREEGVAQKVVGRSNQKVVIPMLNLPSMQKESSAIVSRSTRRLEFQKSSMSTSNRLTNMVSDNRTGGGYTRSRESSAKDRRIGGHFEGNMSYLDEHESIIMPRRGLGGTGLFVSF